MSDLCWKKENNNRCCCNCRYRLTINYCKCGRCTSGKQERAKFDYVCLAFQDERLACAWEAHGLCEAHDYLTPEQEKREKSNEDD